MKFILHTILLLSSLSFFSQEQTNTFNLIATAGVSPAQVHGDAYNGFHKIGGLGGIAIETQFNKKISASLGFIFIQKGARKNPNPTKGDYNAYFLNLNYIEIPLLLAYTKKKYIVDIGVAAAYLINYYEGTEIGNVTGMYPFRKYDFSVKVGLGYRFTDNVFAVVRTSNSFITTRPNYIKQSIYFPNILARTFNKGYYNKYIRVYN